MGECVLFDMPKVWHTHAHCTHPYQQHFYTKFQMNETMNKMIRKGFFIIKDCMGIFSLIIYVKMRKILCPYKDAQSVKCSFKLEIPAKLSLIWGFIYQIWRKKRSTFSVHFNQSHFYCYIDPHVIVHEFIKSSF